MFRRLTLTLVLAAVLAAALGAAAPSAAARSFTVDRVAITAQVLGNGDVRVHEERTLTFDGLFHYVYWDYRTKGSSGIDITGASGPTGAYRCAGTSAGEPGTYSVSDLGGTVRVQLQFALADTRATFAVDYVARRAAVRWSDTAELYWQFIGDEATVESHDVSIEITPPPGVTKQQVRAWAHGPLWGKVMVLPDARVRLTVDPLPPETFVEARLLFPASALSAAARSKDEPRLQQALAAEKKLASAADRDRLLARLKVALWVLLGVGVPLAALVLVVVLYVRYGREPRPAFRGQYLRDFPAPVLPPALVGFIWRMGGVDTDDFLATLLDLIDRGVVRIERVLEEERGLFGTHEEVDYKLTLERDGAAGLEPFEEKLVTFLFDDIAGRDSFAMGELKGLAKADRTGWQQGYERWKTSVKEAGQTRGYLDREADRMAFWGVALGFVAAVASVAAAILGAQPWFFAGLPVGVVLIFAARSIKRRSPEAAELHAQYAAIRRYLKDFGRLQEKPPDAVVLWRHFLVLAVVFGIADEVSRHLEVKVPEVVQDPGFRTMSFVLVPGPGGGPSAFSSLHEGVSGAMAVATSSSSSGGGGGGFSGGGGGGGGGGGFGAG